MEEALDFLRAAGISGAAKYAAGTVFCCVDEAQKIPPALEREAEAVLLKVSEAWSKLVSLPPGAPTNCLSRKIHPYAQCPPVCLLWLGWRDMHCCMLERGRVSKETQRCQKLCCEYWHY